MAPLISLCMIVKDEEANLPACLITVADLVDEIIVVDTGSADRTRECAEHFGARVVDFPWVDDFSAARNESLRHATGEWILWLDADDRIDVLNRDRLRALFASLPRDNVGFVVQYRALQDALVGGTSSVERVALFRRQPGAHWIYRVHEQIQSVLEQCGVRFVPTDIVIDTVGQQDPEAIRAKIERNYRLLLLENADRPGDPLTLWNLGRTTLRSDRVVEAADWLTQALARRDFFNERIQALIYGQLAEALCRLGRFGEALPICQEGRARLPDDIAIMLAEGVVLLELGATSEATRVLTEVLRREPGNGMARAWLARPSAGS